ncbi:unnamed protein product [Cylindrotheca closterium]|uniref:C3H1-type domain-containing protein n=1 Tax=Cylindrotheca closterium TaxID=2856 RepID=A0AAD2CF27_9STRA|nr:unnamed protein product [Cylindrotheca closterium]
MSIPTQYVQRNRSTEASMEDCRDYLRTGRCKYGASCKYRHPPNVQSGGGMKGPINPSEPMFPYRPNEPVCQYYMKHGTCKFGQACKFNHPPHNNNSNNNLHGVPSSPRFNQSMVMQQKDSNEGSFNSYDAAAMLPQRPEEPNCIYFLKNGRCKYGATCRYHHPLNYHSRRPPPPNDGHRHNHHHHNLQGGGNSMNDSGMAQPKLQYISLPPGTYQQGQFVVADGQLAFLSLDGSTQQVISVGPQGVNQEAPMVLTSTASPKPASSLSRDVGSTASSTSIASSFESSMIGSGGSLNTFIAPDQQNGRAAHVVHSGSSRQVPAQNQDGRVASLPQVVSTAGSLDGSINNSNNSNNHSYFDVRRPTQSPVRSESGGNAAAYREQRSSSFDHSSRPARQHMGGGIRESTSVPSFNHVHDEQGYQQQQQQQYDPQQQRGLQMTRGPPPTTARGRQRRKSNGAVDDGLSMMTSALLTMLDTPEEAGEWEQYQDFDDYEPSESSTPVIANHFPGQLGSPQHPQIVQNNNSSSNNGDYNNFFVPQARKVAYYDHDQDRSVNSMPGYQYEGVGGDDGYGIPRGRSMDQMQRWAPSMQGSDQQRASSTAFEPRNNGSYFP